jgi:hypothetical protein
VLFEKNNIYITVTREGQYQYLSLKIIIDSKEVYKEDGIKFNRHPQESLLAFTRISSTNEKEANVFEIGCNHYKEVWYRLFIHKHHCPINKI